MNEKILKLLKNLRIKIEKHHFILSTLGGTKITTSLHEVKKVPKTIAFVYNDISMILLEKENEKGKLVDTVLNIKWTLLSALSNTGSWLKSKRDPSTTTFYLAILQEIDESEIEIMVYLSFIKGKIFGYSWLFSDQITKEDKLISNLIFPFIPMGFSYKVVENIKENQNPRGFAQSLYLDNRAFDERCISEHFDEIQWNNFSIDEKKVFQWMRNILWRTISLRLVYGSQSEDENILMESCSPKGKVNKLKLDKNFRKNIIDYCKNNSDEYQIIYGISPVFSKKILDIFIHIDF